MRHMGVVTKKPRLTLQAKFLILIAVVVSGASVVLSAYYYYAVRAREIAELTAKGRSMTINLAHNSAEGVLFSDTRHLSLLVKLLAEDSDVAGAEITSGDGGTLVRTATDASFLNPAEGEFAELVEKVTEGSGISKSRYRIRESGVLLLEFSIPITTRRVSRDREEIGLMFGGDAGVENQGETAAGDMMRAFVDAGNADAWLSWKEENLAGYADQTLLRSVLFDLREIKTEEELGFLQRAIDITAAAHREAFRSIQPGLHEYEVEAVIEYVFHREGAEHPAFPSIVGSGENSTILHYNSNRRMMEDGDLVVMDIGAEYRGYSADVTRTAPVNGVFSRQQELIYRIVLAAQEAAIAAAVPGASFQDLNGAASAELVEGLMQLAIISNPGEITRFFPHGVSHYLGLDVHDAGTYGPLRPGTVITIEPGLYIPPTPGVDEQWWNIGVRIEDDVLVTESGPVVLSSAAPKSVEAIEALMAG